MTRTTALVLRALVLAAALFTSAAAQANFHLWVIGEAYSNASGTVQYVELSTVQPGQQFLGGHTIRASAPGMAIRSYTFTTDLPGDSANRTFLVGTQGFADLGIVAPDYIVPNGFLYATNGTINFADADIWSYSALPADGAMSLLRNGSSAINSPRNFAGATGSITVERVPYDLNGDGKSDLVWRNGADSSLQGWLMDGLSVTGITEILPGAENMSVTHMGDFNGDGKADLVLRRNSDGVVSIKYTGFYGYSPLTCCNSGWSIVATGDLNDDGRADLLWQHTDGTVMAWLMNAGGTASATFASAGSGWSIIHVADLNGDGKADLVWRHTDGSVRAWLMDGLSAIGTATLVGPGTGWSVTLTADLNGDGKTDLIWLHTDGATQAWLMDGLTVLANDSFTPAGTGWIPILAGDLNGDGKDDLFWQHTSGASQTWLMDGLVVTDIASFVPAGTGWSASHLRDLNGDGKRDVLWKHTDGGVQAWLMDGLTITQIGSLTPAGPYAVVPVAP